MEARGRTPISRNQMPSLGHDVQLDLVRRQERAAGVDGGDVGGGRVGAAPAHLERNRQENVDFRGIFSGKMIA